ncbi:unnamed protein product [Caenorhabditis angaria]|uniref:Uncharacterized protein n=1 Tax=Caenorhabditis angaria TaxID=860376 RepID=A0A9P1N0Z8_9PELO|nr:unnamed protein product [Caenorhabditis angaria]
MAYIDRYGNVREGTTRRGRQQRGNGGQSAFYGLILLTLLLCALYWYNARQKGFFEKALDHFSQLGYSTDWTGLLNVGRLLNTLNNIVFFFF